MIWTGNKDLIPTINAVYLSRSDERSHTIAHNIADTLGGLMQSQLPLIVVSAHVDQALWVMTSKIPPGKAG